MRQPCQRLDRDHLGHRHRDVGRNHRRRHHRERRRQGRRCGNYRRRRHHWEHHPDDRDRWDDRHRHHPVRLDVPDLPDGQGHQDRQDRHHRYVRASCRGSDGAASCQGWDAGHPDRTSRPDGQSTDEVAADSGPLDRLDADLPGAVQQAARYRHRTGCWPLAAHRDAVRPGEAPGLGRLAPGLGRLAPGSELPVELARWR
jgi:hypothetical protein